MFVSPDTDKSCNMLFQYGLELFSAEALCIKGPLKVIDTGLAPASFLLDRLIGRGGFRQAKGARRKALMAALLEAPASTDLDEARLIVKLTDNSKANVVAPAATWPVELRYTTQAGLAGWAQLAPDLRPWHCLELLEGELQPADPDPAERTYKRELLSEQMPAHHFPSLDIHELVKHAHLSLSGLTGFALRWPTLKEPNAFTGVADMQDRQRSYIVVSVVVRGWRQVEVLWLERDHRGRIAFVCPVDGSTQDILYWRGERFGSRAAQRLVHASEIKR